MDWKQTITEVIEGFIDSPENTLGNDANDRAFEKPLVGFARGDDPAFEECKGHIGSFYWTPWEIFEKSFPDTKVKPGELTIISWILPHTKQTKMDNRRERTLPSERWARAKKFGEVANVKLRNHLTKVLQEAGYQAVAPCLSPQWAQQMSEKYLYASNWSERHAAYVAGLGTFGLCDGLITPVGKAVRCGSVIACIDIPPTERPYKKPREYCIFSSEGTCGAYIKRCPAEAITRTGHNKEKCKAYLDKAGAEHARTHYGFDTDTCGLCQTKVPYESGIPAGKKR
jgi:epoxyqueuosine reductase